MSAAFKEYSASVLDKTKRPSVLAKLHNLAQTIANLPDKVRHKQEAVSYTHLDVYKRQGSNCAMLLCWVIISINS